MDPIRISVRGVKNLSKFVSSISSGDYAFCIWIDEFQAARDEEQRWYTVELANIRDGQSFLFSDEAVSTSYILDTNAGPEELEVGTIDFDDVTETRIIRLNKVNVEDNKYE